MHDHDLKFKTHLAATHPAWTQVPSSRLSQVANWFWDRCWMPMDTICWAKFRANPKIDGKSNSKRKTKWMIGWLDDCWVVFHGSFLWFAWQLNCKILGRCPTTPGGVPGPRLKFSFQDGASQARQLLGDLGTLLPPKALTTSYSSSLGRRPKKTICKVLWVHQAPEHLVAWSSWTTAARTQVPCR